jgi:ABC-type transport system involved in cytochrome bd biosynthesis fused ATPase/permease subunit
LLKIGRQLEMQLRMRFMAKIPKLSDRYFQSRLLSDMASRAHSLQALRRLPESVGHCLQLGASIAITGVAIAWVYPGSLPLISAAIIAACATPMLFLPVAAERDLRFREQSASLGSLYLDCLMGSRAIQAHGAQATMLGLQSEQLLQWKDSALRKLALSVGAGSLQTAVTIGCIIALIYQQAGIVRSPAGLLLLVYWAISIPQLGTALAHSVLELPAMRNLLLRFLEPIGAPDEGSGEVEHPVNTAGVKIDIENASIVVAGHAVLTDVSLHIRPGEHVGIVGTSGAGKSTLLGCLLGWYQPVNGVIRVDDQVLDTNNLGQLRHETAWIDPQVHLFGRSLFDNLRYGNESSAADIAGNAIAQSGLGRVFKHWPAGLQTSLGEGGAMVSGGEGQRVRMGRALCRANVRLAVLDEPTRGLGRRQRTLLLERARHHFAEATLFCATHDVSDTLQFDRVLVIEHGRVVENGVPEVLQATPNSRYRQLLDAEAAAGGELWNPGSWRRIRIRRGVLREAARQSRA